MSGTVGIVGAGPGGIVTAAVFARDGFDVTVYEKFDEVGGTWSSERRYVGLAAQADSGIFEFSDEPNDTPFPDAEDVQSYLREYARKHGVYDDVAFETEVVGLAERERGWAVELSDADTGRTETARHDYVVVCSGLHHVPEVPGVPGRERFEGAVLHTSEVDSHSVLEDRDVVTVGFGKSALDLSVEASQAGASSTLVFRRACWHIPRRLLGGQVPYKYLLFSRLGGSLLPQFPHDEVVRPIDRLPARLKDLLWAAITRDFVYSGGLGDLDELVPSNGLPDDIARSGVYPDEFAGRVADGAITPEKARVERFESDGVVLSTGGKVLADLVVFGTGFRQEYPFLDASPLDLRTDDGLFAAYRSLVPPETDRIGFVGLRQTHNNFLSMEVSAHWLAAYFQGELPSMPTTEEMYADVERRLQWFRETLPRNQGYDFGPYVVHTPEQLLLDMGIGPNQAPNPLVEYLAPVKARWYDDLHEKRVAATRDGASG